MSFWHGANPEYELGDGETSGEVQWTENQILYLVRLYRQHPCLWMKADPSYLNYYARRLAYETIHGEVSALGVSVVEVMVVLRELRKNYVDELTKMVEAESIGSPYESQYTWFDELDDYLYANLHVDEIETIQVSS